MAMNVQRATPQKLVALGELADRAFRPQLPPGSGMPKEYARLFHPDNAENLYYVADDQGTPISMVATYPCELVVGPAKLSAIAIGSVGTLADYRGRGHATEILNNIVEAVRSEYALMLVSGARPLYDRLGCVPFGQLLKAAWVIDDHDLQHEAAVVEEVSDMASVAHALHRVYVQESCRYRRTLEEMISFLESISAPRYRSRSQATRVFSIEVQGEIAGYAVATPSRDGTRVEVLEWAGTRSHVVSLVERATRRMGASLVELRLQPEDVSLRAALINRGISLEPVPNQGTLSILDLGRLVTESSPLITERFGSPLSVVSEESGELGLAWSEPETRLHELPLPSHCDRRTLATWLYTPSGLNLPLPDTAGLNFV